MVDGREGLVDIVGGLLEFGELRDIEIVSVARSLDGWHWGTLVLGSLGTSTERAGLECCREFSRFGTCIHISSHDPLADRAQDKGEKTDAFEARGITGSRELTRQYWQRRIVLSHSRPPPN